MNRTTATEVLAPILLPSIIDRALREGATLAVSVSGGKDSQAMLNALSRLHRERAYPGIIYAIHADLGRAEWAQTPAHVEAMCAAAGVELRVVRRPKGDLVARIEERIEKLAGTDKPAWPSADNRYCTSHLKAGPIDAELRKKPAPAWPSAENRFCTSDLKRGPIDTDLRAFGGVIISAEGVRANESRERAKKPGVEIRTAITSASSNRPDRNLIEMTPEAAYEARLPGQRLALNWRPLLHWTEAQVWEACGTSVGELEVRRALYRAGHHEEALRFWRAHPAYVMGNERLSCALCVLASKSDLVNGANAHPHLYAHYLQLEADSKSTFRHGFSLIELPVIGEAAELKAAFLKEHPEAAPAQLSFL